MLKRLFDLTAAALGLLTLSPILLIIGACILATDGAPVFFRQSRVGRNGQPFTLLKFRSMRNKAGAERGSFDAGDSSRVTKIGRFLRNTKLDELPQLINVLRGDMSLVGPRPEVSQWVAAYPERWRHVHTVRPGITDPASLAFRDEEALLAAQENPNEYYRAVILPKKLDYYDTYIDNASFARDLKLILSTVATLLGRK